MKIQILSGLPERICYSFNPDYLKLLTIIQQFRSLEFLLPEQQLLLRVR